MNKVLVGIALLLLGCGAAAMNASDASMTLDKDHDGLVDAEDECPLVPEDYDGDADEDGCPECTLKDSDEDGLLDTMDACPDAAEDRDGVDDGDGCPE